MYFLASSKTKFTKQMNYLKTFKQDFRSKKRNSLKSKLLPSLEKRSSIPNLVPHHTSLT